MSETPEADKIMTQIKNYEAKSNALEHGLSTLSADIAHHERERQRLQVLVELEEAQDKELADTEAALQTAVKQKGELEGKLKLSRRAMAELESRLEVAEKQDRQDGFLRHAETFQEATEAVLKQLEKLEPLYEKLKAERDPIGSLLPGPAVLRHNLWYGRPLDRELSEFRGHLEADNRAVQERLERAQNGTLWRDREADRAHHAKLKEQRAEQARYV